MSSSYAEGPVETGASSGTPPGPKEPRTGYARTSLVRVHVDGRVVHSRVGTNERSASGCWHAVVRSSAVRVAPRNRDGRRVLCDDSRPDDLAARRRDQRVEIRVRSPNHGPEPAEADHGNQVNRADDAIALRRTRDRSRRGRVGQASDSAAIVEEVKRSGAEVRKEH